jgi:glycosyltransferase involved in cell wall biosynthesis
MAFKNLPSRVWIVGSTLFVFAIVLGLIYYTGTMNAKFHIDDEMRRLTNYDAWPQYDRKIAFLPPNAKSRSVVLLHAYVPFWNAGSEICCHTVNKLLVERGHEVWVGVPGYPYKTYEGVHIFDLNDREMLHGLMKHAHVISTHSYREKAIKLSNQYGVAFVDWFHGGTYTAKAKDAGALNENPRYWAVFNSDSLLASFSEIHESRYHILRPPVNWRDYEIGQGNNPQYVTLSNLNENKGGQILIDIAKAAPEIQFLGVRGSYWKQIEDHSVKNIKYMNNTPRIKDVYAITKILIMPSKDETWGRTAIEAMSSGIPVIASPTHGLRECCESSALFVERFDIPEWVRLIRRLLSDQSFYDEYSNRGKIRARQLEPTHDLEMFQEWYETKVIVSMDKTQAVKPTLIESYYDLFA